MQFSSWAIGAGRMAACCDLKRRVGMCDGRRVPMTLNRAPMAPDAAKKCEGLLPTQVRLNTDRAHRSAWARSFLHKDLCVTMSAAHGFCNNSVVEYKR